MQEERSGGVPPEESGEGREAVDPEVVLSYWFPEGDIFDADRETFGRQMQWWFQGGPEVDREISERFGGVLELARTGELDHWVETPRGRLALIVVLDQFSRNVYRGSTRHPWAFHLRWPT